MSVSGMVIITSFDIFDILSLFALKSFLFYIGKYDLASFFQSLDAIFSLFPFSPKTQIDDLKHEIRERELYQFVSVV